jgi:hypothetical protein
VLAFGKESKLKYDTTVDVKTFDKKFHVETCRTDWSRRVEGVPDTSTVAGRCFAHYGTLKSMPGGQLLKFEVKTSDINTKELIMESVEMSLKKAATWYEKPNATFGPFGKKAGSFTKLDEGFQQSTRLTLQFPSVAAALTFYTEISRGHSSVSPEVATPAASCVAAHPLQGSIVVSSVEPGMGKAKAGIEVGKCGGKVATSVSNKTTHLVCGSSGGAYAGAGFDAFSGSKTSKAKELNAAGKASIKLIGEAEFLQLMSESSRKRDAAKVEQEQPPAKLARLQ